MSISSEISRISGNISDSFDAIEAKGVTVPSGSNSDNLATLISQINVGASIDDTTIASDKTWSSSKINSELAEKYELPSGGIPSTDLSSSIQTSLGNADSAYQKPAGGIPASDLASSVLTSIIDDTTTANNKVWSSIKVQSELDGKMDASTVSGSETLIQYDDNIGGRAISVTANIDPVQDLNGYDKPWTGGYGKNKFQTTATTDTISNVTFTVNSDGSVKISGVPSAAVSTYIFGEVTLPAGTYNANGFSGGASNGLRMVFLNKGTSSALATVYGGNDVSFTLDASTTVKVYPIVPSTFDGTAITMYPMIRLSTEIDASFVPYSNICPIAGWQKSKITVTSPNLIGGVLLRDAIKNAIPSANINETNKTIEFASNAEVSSAIIGKGTMGLGLKFLFKENTPYTFIISGYNTGSGAKSINIRVNYTDGSYNYITDFASTEATKQTTIFTSNSSKTILSVTKSNRNNSNVFYYDECGIFEGTVTVNDFVPFGRYYEITYPNEAGTVYGGKLEVKPDGSGVLTVDRLYESLSSKTWTTRVTGSVKVLLSSSVAQDYITGTTSSYKADFISDYYSVPGSTSAAAVTVDDIDVRSLGLYGLRTTAGSSTTIYTILYIGDTPQGNIAYGLMTPITYNVTAAQITTILGENNIWADTGDVSISLANLVDDSSTAVGSVWSASKASTELAGKIDKPASPTSGSFLVYNGTAWVAQTLSTWQGGSY